MTKKELYDQIDSLSDELTNLSIDGQDVVILLADFAQYGRTGGVNGLTIYTIANLVELIKRLIDNCDEDIKADVKELILKAVLELC